MISVELLLETFKRQKNEILETKKRPSSVIPLPANGLTLVEVNYD